MYELASQYRYLMIIVMIMFKICLNATFDRLLVKG